MNRENLKAIADHILTIDQEKFDMNYFRYSSNDRASIKCNSIGCTLGHSVELDKDVENIPRARYNYDIGKYYPTNEGPINFVKWGEQFTGLEAGEDEWDWCFHSNWYHKDNTVEGASKRINWLLDHGLPENWRDQLWRKEVELCYK